MNSSDRIIQYLDYKGIFKNKFYTEINVSIGYLTKKPEISTKILKQIIEKYTDLNLYWLVTGHGNMLVDATEQLVRQQAQTPDMLREIIAQKDNIINDQRALIATLQQLVSKYEKGV